MSLDGNFDEFAQTAIDVARRAGKFIQDAFRKEKRIQEKSSASDLVTETDTQVEEFIFSELKKKYPDHCFIGEESSSSAGEKCDWTDNPTWMIDPVDGTMNFVHCFPFVAVCIGLTVNKQVVVGVVYNPVRDQMYHAVRGKGAFCNGEKLTVSGQTNLGESLVITEIGSSRDEAILSSKLRNISSIIHSGVRGMRSLGSAALNMCEIAQGHADLYYEYGIHCWDYAAASIIVEEAGGVVIDPSGGQLDLLARRCVAGSSSQNALALSKLLTPIEFPRD